MKITRKNQSILIDKQRRLKVRYYLFKEYEIHWNRQRPNTTQEWHHHNKIHETLFIVHGQLIARWKEGDKICKSIVREGDIIETESTPHTFSNDSKSDVKFIVFKQVLTGKNKRNLLKSDKIVD